MANVSVRLAIDNSVLFLFFSIIYSIYSNRDRLNIPFSEDAFADTEQQKQEIIEEYSEEEEKRWRLEHKIKVAKQKQHEAKQRCAGVDDDKDYMQILEDALLLEELEKEMEELGIENDEQLRDQLSGDKPASIEQRTQELNELHDVIERFENVNELTANAESDEDEASDESDDDHDYPAEFLAIREQAKHLIAEEQLDLYEKHLRKVTEFLSKQKVKTYSQLNETVDKRALQECLMNVVEELREELPVKNDVTENLSDETDEDIHQDSQAIAMETDHGNFSRKQFAKLEKDYAERSKGEQLVFYKSQLRNVIKLLSNRSPNLPEDEMEERRFLYDYLIGKIDYLRNAISKEKQAEMEERFVDDDSDNESADDDNDMDDTGSVICHDGPESSPEPQGRRRISFAAQPTVTTYHLEDEPWCVLKSNEDNMNTLMDKTFQFFNSPDNSGDEAPIEKASDQINNLEVKSIKKRPKTVTVLPDESTVKFEDGPTLAINFKHSLKSAWPVEKPQDPNMIQSPADIYKRYGAGREIAGNQPPAEKNLLRDYVMNVANLDVNAVTERMRKMYASKDLQKNADGSKTAVRPRPEVIITEPPRKSILKNKEAVNLEVHEKNNESPSKMDRASNASNDIEPYNSFVSIL